VEQFARLDRTNVVSTDGDQGNGLLTAINELNVVALAVLVRMDDRTNVTAR
jgi:hypothetical protein